MYNICKETEFAIKLKRLFINIHEYQRKWLFYLTLIWLSTFLTLGICCVIECANFR